MFRCEPGPSGHRGSECGRLSVGGGKEGKDIWNGTGFQLQQKPLRLNASPRFCLWVSLTTDVISASEPNFCQGSFQFK